MTKTNLSALTALARNAGYEVETLADEDCQTINHSKYMLTAVSMFQAHNTPPHAADFLLYLGAMSKGNYAEKQPFNDKAIAHKMRVSQSTVTRKRKAFILWEEGFKLNWLGIDEGERLESQQYDDTLYLITFPHAVTRVMNIADERGLFERDFNTKAVIDEIRRISLQVSKEMPETVIQRRYRHEKPKLYLVNPITVLVERGASNLLKSFEQSGVILSDIRQAEFRKELLELVKKYQKSQ